jgi:DNA-binding transcriptional MerR regulator
MAMSEAREADDGFHAIGEVLTLLRGEFPDITISKIRFLESQGLLEPERTPAGYRRFYAHDIARLRWILRQQREHFLPLKVIKARLRESDRAADAAGQAHGAPETDLPDAPSNMQLPLDTPGIPTRPRPQGSTPVRSGASTPAETAPSVTATVVVDTIETIETIIVSVDAATPVSDAISPTTVVRPLAEAPTPTAATASPALPRAAEPTRRVLPEPAIFAGRHRNPESAPGRVSSTASVPRSNPNAAAPDVAALPGDRSSEVALSLADLCTAAGLDPATIRDLERYDLLESRESGATPHYDGHALAVCRSAAMLIQQGVEVRHLRMFVVALERELSLFDQLLLPARRGRGDDALHARQARREALVREGERLRAALLERMLHDDL